MFCQQCAFAGVSFVLADVGTGQASRNQYLPPDKGYNYDKPNVQFTQQPTRPQPNQVLERHNLQVFGLITEISIQGAVPASAGAAAAAQPATGAASAATAAGLSVWTAAER